MADLSEINSKKNDQSLRSSVRIYALDALRSTMFFMVVLFHCALSYMIAPSLVWTFKDDRTAIAADIIVRFIHLFTLPTFFILAGFFSAMLYLKLGPSGFARNRAKRILVPFIVGWVFLHPLVGAGFLFAHVAQDHSISIGVSAVWSAAKNGSLFFTNSTIHLWFMYVLLFFYLFAHPLRGLLALIPETLRRSALVRLSLVMKRPFARLMILVPITYSMLLMVGGTLYTNLSFVPDWRLLLGYGLYYAFGWLLYLVRSEIRFFRRFAWTQIISALVIFILVGRLLRTANLDPSLIGPLTKLSTIVGALLVWLMFFGLTGIFLRYVNSPSMLIRYIVDSSFWIYLIHLPVTIWIAGALSQVDLFPGGKIILMLCVVYGLGFVSYDLFVRSTFIGTVLNGRKHPRALFRFSS